jgi:methionine sulfoxide reductase heme-binding subunit
MGRDQEHGGGDARLELVNERQVAPLVFGGVFVLLMIAGSYGLVHLMYPTGAAQNNVFWYIERAAGFTSYELLSLTAILGVTSRSGIWDQWKLRYVMTQLHQFVSILLLAFIALHLFGLHEDSTIPFPWTKLLVPFASTYRPLPTGCGVLALYGILVLVFTSWIRDKIGVKFWKSVHFLSFPTFALVTLHGLLAGTDSGSHQALWLYLVPILLFAIGLSTRIRKASIRELA